MHGIILTELKKFVVTRHGTDVWSKLLQESGLGLKTYLATSVYPDKDVLEIVNTAATMTGIPPKLLLEDFGEFIVPGLVKIFGPLIRPEWKTIDLIENTEGVIHKAVRLNNPGARPPELRCYKSGPGAVVITYSSERKICAVAKGIVRGVANHYGERIIIDETDCMLKGAPVCNILVRII